MSKSKKGKKKKQPALKNQKGSNNNINKNAGTDESTNETAPAAPERSILLPAIIGLLLVIGATAAGLLLFKGDKAIDAQNYNLMVITLDTLRADHVGVYGHETAQTPNLDRLAREGVMFENCYSTVPLTLPAHSSIFTGRYPLAHRVRGNGTYVMPETEITLAEIFKDKGFNTFAVISSFVLLAKFGLNQGFDFFDDSLDSHKMYNNYNSEIPATSVYRKFLQWFEKNHRKRFFVWIHFYDPHTPYKAPKRFAEKFKSDIPGRYDAEIAFTDEGVGKIIEALEKTNTLQNTLVVIAGDHGEAFGEHEEWGHGIFCYEEALKVPLIFYNPRLLPQNGLRIKNRVNLVDIMPTLLELYGITPPRGIQGNSFTSMLKGEREKEVRSFYFESMHGKDEMNWAPLMGIIDRNYKYISLPEPELYDLDTDPMEKENLFWKKNRLAKELDKILMKEVTTLSKAGSGRDAKRELTAEDKKHLTSLGYISSFSDKSNKDQDPKKGIVLDNRIKRIFRIIGNGNLDRAETELNALIAKHKQIDLPIFYDLLHQLYLKREDVDKNIRILKEAMEKFPKIERFYILYAFKIFDKGLIEETEHTCHKLMELNPRFTRAYILLGQVEEKRQQIDKAIVHYKKALDIEPQNISLKLKYAELMIRKKGFHTALSIYDDLLNRREVTGNADLLYKVALLHSTHGSLEKSEQLLKRTVTLKPGGKYYFSYAMILSRNKKQKEALDNMEIALNKYRAELNEQQVQLATKAVGFWKRNR